MKKFIFDVDGTLTPSRRQIDLGFETFMIKFACLYPVYLVTGSNREKTIEQIGLDLYNRSKRVYNCAGNDIYERENLVYRNSWTCLLYTSPRPRDVEESRMGSSA